jgi:pimeloyl-ACP methyl ester carboxylesterase
MYNYWLDKIFRREGEQKQQHTVYEPETEEFKPTVVWLHGANQTSLGFSYLRRLCDFENEYLVDYSSNHRFFENLKQMVQDLNGRGPFFFVGHSMGGLYALHLSQQLETVGGISISTPFRGSSAADWAKYLVPNYALFKDIGRRSLPVSAAECIQIDIPWYQIVSVNGNVPYVKTPNDGVCTLASMTCRNDMKHIQVPHNHYEVMCSTIVADIIKEKYSEISRAYQIHTNE